MSAPVTGSPLSIAVVGVGGVGSTFAYHLARAGHDVTAIARPGSLRLEQLRRDRGIVHTTSGRAEVRAADALDEQAEYDLVVVTTLAHQVDALLPALKRSKARRVHFMFNNFEAERLANATGPARCSFGMPFVMATVDGEGRLDSKVNPGQKTLHGDQRWVELFNAAGIPSAFEGNMPLWLRCHVPMCISFESISIMARRRGGGASWAQSIVVARGMRSGFAVIKAQGYPLYPTAKSLLGSCPTFLLASMLWSMSRIASFRELLATGLNECRALVEVVATAALEVRPALPAAAAALQAMKPTEAVPPRAARVVQAPLA